MTPNDPKPPSPQPTDDDPELLRLARIHFEKLARDPQKNWNPPLTPSEELLIRQTAAGEFADYSDRKYYPEGDARFGPPYDRNYPGNADSWEPARVIRAQVITWLCTYKHAKDLVTRKGIQIWGARIEGQLDLEESDVPFRLGFFQSRVKEDVRLLGARVKGIYWDGSHVVSISAFGPHVEDNVYLRNGFSAKGEVNLIGANFGGSLDCVGGTFENEGEGKYAFVADGVVVKGSVFLRNGFSAKGEVRLLGANISGDLDCVGGTFENEGEGKYAFVADGVEVKGSVYLRNQCEVRGTISLVAASMGHFHWYGHRNTQATTLDLRSAQVGTLWDEEPSWPAQGNLWLDGFTYDRIHEDAPLDAEARLKWIRLDCSEKFNPQPYEQLAAVLKKQGHEKDSRKILIAKEEDRSRITSMKGVPLAWHKMLGATIGYGHEPWRCIKFILAFLIFGASFFQIGEGAGLMMPTSDRAFQTTPENPKRTISPDYPDFNAFFYSLDEFAPLVNLRQGDFWIPNYNRDVVTGTGTWPWVCYLCAMFLRLYLWIHILAGWTLTTLLVAGLTGLVRK